jgi:hypothetical protein
MIRVQRGTPGGTPINRQDAENVFVCLDRLGARHMAHVMVMAHGAPLLTAALCADEYLIVQIKSTIARLNLLESQLATTDVAVR